MGSDPGMVRILPGYFAASAGIVMGLCFPDWECLIGEDAGMAYWD